MSTVMSDFIEVAKAGELKSGEIKSVVVQGREILLARVGEQYFAAEDRCRHMGGKLSRGKLEGTVVTCPLHGSQYDLKDRHLVRWTTWPSALLAVDQLRSKKRPLPVFPGKVEGDRISIKL